MIRSSNGKLEGFIFDISSILVVALAGCDTLWVFNRGLSEKGIRLIIAGLRPEVTEKLILDWGEKAEVKGLFARSLDEAVAEFQSE